MIKWLTEPVYIYNESINEKIPTNRAKCAKLLADANQFNVGWVAVTRLESWFKKVGR